MWVWHTTLIETDPAGLLAFATSHQINTLYLQTSPAIAAGSYESFIGSAAAQGIQVIATNGDPTWALSANLPALTAFVDWVGTYNAAAPAPDRFRALNLDVEGYLAPGWSTGPSAVVSQWMGNIQTATSDAAAAGLSVSVDIPFWLDTVTAPGANEPFGRWMAQHTAQIVIMAYRNSASGVVSVAAPELADAAAAGHPAVVAVDTTDSGSTTSFYGTTQGALAQALNQIATSSGAGIDGWAVNEYETWSVMSPT